jgi:hypothetical protein
MLKMKRRIRRDGDMARCQKWPAQKTTKIPVKMSPGSQQSHQLTPRRPLPAPQAPCPKDQSQGIVIKPNHAPNVQAKLHAKPQQLTNWQQATPQPVGQPANVGKANKAAIVCIPREGDDEAKRRAADDDPKDHGQPPRVAASSVKLAHSAASASADSATVWTREWTHRIPYCQKTREGARHTHTDTQGRPQGPTHTGTTGHRPIHSPEQNRTRLSEGQRPSPAPTPPRLPSGRRPQGRPPARPPQPERPGPMAPTRPPPPPSGPRACLSHMVCETKGAGTAPTRPAMRPT